MLDQFGVSSLSVTVRYIFNTSGGGHRIGAERRFDLPELPKQIEKFKGVSVDTPPPIWIGSR
jgi:hypothetical protein